MLVKRDETTAVHIIHRGINRLFNSHLIVYGSIRTVARRPFMTGFSRQTRYNKAEDNEHICYPRQGVQDICSTRTRVFKEWILVHSVQVCDDSKRNDLESSVEDLQSSNRLPHPPPPRPRAQADDDTERRHASENDASLRSVTSRPPESAKRAICILTIIVFASWEWSALVIGVLDAPVIARPWEVDDLAVAAFK